MSLAVGSKGREESIRAVAALGCSTLLHNCKRGALGQFGHSPGTHSYSTSVSSSFSFSSSSPSLSSSLSSPSTAVRWLLLPEDGPQTPCWVSCAQPRVRVRVAQVGLRGISGSASAPHLNCQGRQGGRI